jgi:signal transduction histidine kinase
VRLFQELERRNRELTEALDRQTATAEILRVISQAQADIQPVFEAIADSAMRLFGAWSASVHRYEDGLIRLAATRGGLPGTGQVFMEQLQAPRQPTDDVPRDRAVMTGTVQHVVDVEADQAWGPRLRERASLRGFHSGIWVPMLRGEDVVGVIGVMRERVGGFAPVEIALIQTFADQAVIAVENARLLSELQAKNATLTEALGQQTATSEILRVISSSPTDLQPVFDAIAERAMHLCGASSAGVSRFDGELVHQVALANTSPEAAAAVRSAFPMPPSSRSAAARAILTGGLAHIPDVLEDPEYGMPPQAQATFRSIVAVPMLHQGQAIGAVAVGRPLPGPFSERQIALLQTFADQAVIAIENVRLFTELQTRNRELSEALEHQTATSEILRVISRSPTDVQPVFDAIAETAARLCGAEAGQVTRFDGEQLHLGALYGSSAAGIEAVRRLFPRRLSAGVGASERAIRDRAVVHIADILLDEEYRIQEAALASGYRAILGVPMLREDRAIGTILIGRAAAGAFSPRQIELLRTFAAQAVIAIENVRLFQELQARTRELGRSVEELKALGEVGRAVSSTLDLETVLTTIAARAVQLSAGSGGVIYEYDDVAEEFGLRATHGMDDALSQALQAAPIRLGEGAMGQAGLTRRPVQAADLLDERTVVLARVRSILTGSGYRSLLAVPLLLDQRLMGGLVIWRRQSGNFASEIVNLLQTFATQSVLAIQNARLFRELDAKSRQLEAASRHKSEFLANMSHELRTPLNAVIGFSEVLQERMFGELNPKQGEYVQDIHASGRHLLSLVNDILDLSKVEAGRMELELSVFNLQATVEAALTLVRERAARHGVELELVLDPRLGELTGDERKIRQVLLNLLSNAVKFTPDGGRIIVTARAGEGIVEVSVRDTGIGIAPEDQAEIFEEFRQVGHDDARKQGGTGLGLTLAKRFVELHGGRIGVQSQPGQGPRSPSPCPCSPPERARVMSPIERAAVAGQPRERFSPHLRCGVKSGCRRCATSSAHAPREAGRRAEGRHSSVARGAPTAGRRRARQHRRAAGASRRHEKSPARAIGSSTPPSRGPAQRSPNGRVRWPLGSIFLMLRQIVRPAGSCEKKSRWYSKTFFSFRK